jgi:hypothetical protein
VRVLSTLSSRSYLDPSFPEPVRCLLITAVSSTAYDRPLELVQIVVYIIQMSDAFEASCNSYFARGKLIKFANIRKAPGIPAGSWRNQA